LTYCTNKAGLAFAGLPLFLFSLIGTVFAAAVGGLQYSKQIAIPTACQYFFSDDYSSVDIFILFHLYDLIEQ
jgi:hypothetical protein